MTIASRQAGVFPVSFGYYPPEGSRCVTAQYDWTVATSYTEDLSQLVARGVETAIQAAYIDCSQCAGATTMLIEGTGQVIGIPSNSQGCVPLLFTGAPLFTISNTNGSGLSRVYFLNVPLQTAGFWKVGI
jgi:hypothetical protein